MEPLKKAKNFKGPQGPVFAYVYEPTGSKENSKCLIFRTRR
jgi:hypothetical protein